MPVPAFRLVSRFPGGSGQREAPDLVSSRKGTGISPLPLCRGGILGRGRGSSMSSEQPARFQLPVSDASPWALVPWLPLFVPPSEEWQRLPAVARLRIASSSLVWLLSFFSSPCIKFPLF